MNHDHEAYMERMMLDEIAFWGIHTFYDHSMGMSCARCGWFFHDAIHYGTINGPTY